MIEKSPGSLIEVHSLTSYLVSYLHEAGIYHLHIVQDKEGYKYVVDDRQLHKVKDPESNSLRIYIDNTGVKYSA